MYTVYENQHPDHTERRRQALRDAAAHDRAVRRRRHAGNETFGTPLSINERRRLLTAIAEGRSVADEIHVDPLHGWRNDPLAPRQPYHPAWHEFMHGGVAWALTMVLAVSIVLMTGVWP